jgi:glutathione peroxidase
MTALQEIPVDTITGETTNLGAYAGNVLLVVNVASKCGLTPQYEGLEAMYSQYKDQGLVVLGFPANNFLEQEPGTNEEIVEFCSLNYSVDFPLFSKVSVLGDDQHPLFTELTSKYPTADTDKTPFRERLSGFDMTPSQDPDVLWNFEKFLVSRDGEVVGRFAPATAPDDPAVVAKVEAELAK